MVGRDLTLSRMAAPRPPFPPKREGNGRGPLPRPVEWAQPPREAAVTSPGRANWELPVAACLWENRPPVPRALPGYLHKTLCPCQFLTDPSSSRKNQSHQTRGGRLTRAKGPQSRTLAGNGSKKDAGETHSSRFETGPAFRVQDPTAPWVTLPPAPLRPSSASRRHEL